MIDPKTIDVNGIERKMDELAEVLATTVPDDHLINLYWYAIDAPFYSGGIMVTCSTSSILFNELVKRGIVFIPKSQKYQHVCKCGNLKVEYNHGMPDDYREGIWECAKCGDYYEWGT